MPVTIVYLCEMPEVEVIEIDDQSTSPHREPDVVDLTTEEEVLSPPWSGKWWKSPTAPTSLNPTATNWK